MFLSYLHGMKKKLREKLKKQFFIITHNKSTSVSICINKQLTINQFRMRNTQIEHHISKLFLNFSCFTVFQKIQGN